MKRCIGIFAIILCSCLGNGKILPHNLDLYEGEESGIDVDIEEVSKDMSESDLIQEMKPEEKPAVEVESPKEGIFEGQETAVDIGVEEVEELEPIKPFAPCDKKKKCLDSEQSLCLFLPSKEEGICVKPCKINQPNQCPSWQECEPIGTGKPDEGACFEVIYNGEACSVFEGTMCNALKKEYCLDKTGSTTVGVCTKFCIPNQSSCPWWQECIKISNQSYACFDREPPPSCEQGCPDGKVCVGEGCLKECKVQGECDTGTFCMEIGNKKACIPSKVGVGGVCAPRYGLMCRDGLSCVIPTNSLKGYCVSQCSSNKDCPTFTTCINNKCIPYDRIDPLAKPCTDLMPCKDPGRKCIKVSEGLSMCLIPCIAGGPCPSGTECHEGGCVHISKLGEICGPDRGIICEKGLSCDITESEDHHFGVCTKTCPCPEGFECVSGKCARLADNGKECSIVGGIYCNQGFDCLILDGSLRRGICSAPCNMGENCVPPFQGANAQCLYPGNPSHCGLLCSDLGGECPDFMTCLPYNTCGF